MTTARPKKSASASAAGKNARALRSPEPAALRIRKSPAAAVDEQLARYQSMRDFAITAEPSGGGAKTKAGRAPLAEAATSLPFVVQKHAASHLHYDFRLGWQGVLKSWACAKGPSLSPKDKRLAVQVEDHPIEYAGFEGIIPAGQYGGGTVMVWDQGTWTPQPGHEDVDQGLRDGALKFLIHGTKMHGKWTLIRMHPREHETKPAWLLIKEHDEFERADRPLTDAEPDSVVTGRSLEEIAKASDHVWQSKGGGKTSAAKDGVTKASPKQSKVAAPISKKVKTLLQRCPAEKQPAFTKPELATEAASPPTAAGWLHELKLDGYRIQARKASGNVQLLTRSGLDWTHRLQPVAAAVAQLSAEHCTLDGEVVVLDEAGNSSFAGLQAWFQDDASKPLAYFAFDLLHLDGHNLRGLPLRERKQLLSSVLSQDDATVRISEHLETSGEVMFQHACALHAEGIVSKRADSLYESRRSADWLKCKCLHEQEFVIGGYTLSSEGTDRIGSLLLGYYDGDADKAKLIYAGRTGTGFTQTMKRALQEQLGALAQTAVPFAAVPTAARRGSHWVRPQLVAQVRFATWTGDGLVRQAAFLGLREDKTAGEVRREEASKAPAPKQKRGEPKAGSESKARAVAAKPPGIRLTHPDKVIDTASELTKQELASYYQTIAPYMLPYIAGRPLSLVRCPDGAGHPCFFQKHVNAMLPKSIDTIQVVDHKTGKSEPYISLSTPEALISLAQLGVLEIHPWGSRNDNLEQADTLIFDLDPDEAIDWKTLCGAANEVRRRLAKAGLKSFLKLTGGKGLHIVAPIEPADWTTVKAAAHRFALALERDHPTLFLSKMSKAARKQKIFCDYLRNERGSTAVAPYSPRARPGVHVALPLKWSALQEAARPSFAVRDLREWEQFLKDRPWKTLSAMRQTFDATKF